MGSAPTPTIPTYPDPFRSSRLVYRAVDPTDDDFLFSVANNGHIMANAFGGLVRPMNKKGMESIRERMDKALLGVLICLPAEDKGAEAEKEEIKADAEKEGEKKTTEAEKKKVPVPIGFINLFSMSPASQSNHYSMLGISILPEYQSKGYGSEAINWALNWGFQLAGLHRIEISCFEYNDGAKRLYERLGFVIEGRKREMRWYQGRFWDMIDMAMLEGEWREKMGLVTT